jgi:hypothetical protein
MWNLFKRLQPESITNRYKTLDWSQVTTLEEVTYILSKMRLTKNIMIDEDCWNDPKIKNLLGKDITETTYIGFEKTTKVYKE